MSYLARVLRPRAEAPITTSAQLAALVRRGYETESGAFVTPELALALSTVFACVRVLSEGVATLPLHLYRRLAGGKERAADHWAYRLLHDAPNPWQTAFEFWEMMQAFQELEGNAYAVMTVVRNEVRELLPVVPTRVQVEQYADYRLVYKVTLPGGGEPLRVPQERMLHMRGAFSLNGITGVSPVTYQRETIGLGLQLAKHGARMLRNGAMIGGVIQHPALLEGEAYKHLKESFDEQYSGVNNVGKTLLLEEGATFQTTGMTAEDMQYLEARKFQRAEIAGFYRVPLHMINDLERATFSNIEEQSIGYVVHSLGPRLKRNEQRIARAILGVLPEREQREYYVEFLVEGLLRGNTLKRYQAHQIAINSGWLNRNEVREIEGRNRVEGLDEYLTPANITGKQDGVDPADADDAPPPPDDSDDGADEPPARRSRKEDRNAA